ncbi:polyprenyl synthetase family protein [Microvirga sp. W0021]|uniref:Polyprenyl synthetase family protein n=1 Tax=Hohaiivirga grylli TaxID=3133970 RepID=A0ABV0BL92_9HYPH
MVSQNSLFSEHLTQVATEVELYLAELLTNNTTGREVARPRRLVEAMRYAVLAGGKRLRPFLTIEVTRLLSAEMSDDLKKQAFWAASATELIHCYSLVHDDLPSMDDDDLRRGKPTLHKAYDEATAILAGDALQALAFAELADERHCPDAHIRSELVLGLAQASGIGGMVGGQLLDLAQEGRYGAVDPSVDDIKIMQAMKTGALISYSVDAGAIIASADEPLRTKLRIYGDALGVAFQIADDLLDLDGTAAELGKATGKDVARGKITLVERIGVEAARNECKRLLEQALDALDGFGSKADMLRDAARFVIERRV